MDPSSSTTTATTRSPWLLLFTLMISAFSEASSWAFTTTTTLSLAYTWSATQRKGAQPSSLSSRSPPCWLHHDKSCYKRHDDVLRQHHHFPNYRRKDLTSRRLVDPVHSMVDQLVLIQQQFVPHQLHSTIEEVVTPRHFQQLQMQEQHASDSIHQWISILTTMLTSTTTGASITNTDPLLNVNGITITNLNPAHEHTQPFWGPPDPYLTAGKSIQPSARALLGMGIEKVSSSSSSATTEALSSSIQETITPNLDVASTTADAVAAQSALAAQGYYVLDGSKMSIPSSGLLPGFARTYGILSEHNPQVLSTLQSETPADFLVQVQWSLQLLNIVDQLPAIAFMYALVEFFFIRPNLDLYKEDIEQEPITSTLEVMSVTGVRLVLFVIITVVTINVWG